MNQSSKNLKFDLSVSTLILFCFFLFQLSAQEFTPVATQFTKSDYMAASQNWAIGQTSDGTIYFGNNIGLLQFDGGEWKTYKIPQNKIIRSIYVSSDDKIFVGSYEEFGFFKKDEFGQLKYTSLSDKLQKYKMQNDEIWTIIEYDKKVVFQSFTSYFIYENSKVSGFRTPYVFLFFNLYKNQIYTSTEAEGFGLISIPKQQFTSIDKTILQSKVSSVLSYDKNKTLLVTNSNGLFLFDGSNITPFHTDVDESLKKAYVNRAVISKSGLILLGTILDGVFAINKSGNKVWKLNTSNVLQNNTVLGMYCDQDDNLWLALDKGIAYIQTNSQIKYIHSFSPYIGSIYSILYASPNLYLGTNQGLYEAHFNLNNLCVSDIHLVSQIKGQVWNLSQIENQIFCGNNEETFDISENQIQKTSSVRGGICIKEGTINGQQVLVQGTYSNLCIYKRNNGKWKFSHNINGFINPIRYVEIDYKGIIWAGHLHQGLYAIRLTNDLKNVAKITTFASLNHRNKYPIGVFSINNRVIFTDNTGFYTYDDLKNKIIPYNELNNQLGYLSHTNKICHFKDNLYWFLSNDASALVRVKDDDIRVLQVMHDAPYINQIIDDFKEITTIDNNNCLMNLENGLAIIKTDLIKRDISKPLLSIKSVIVSDDKSETFKYLPVKDNIVPETSHKLNNIVVTVSYPNYLSINNLYYRYKLEGLDKIWSEPSLASHKEYNYLPHNRYTLLVQTLTKSGNILSETSYTFIVRPPFYLTILAKCLYLLFVITLLIIVYRYYLSRFEKKRKKIHQEQEHIRLKEIEKRERQITILEKEKLESELTQKSKELAISTMTIIKKNEMLAEIKQEVMHQKKILGSQYPNKYYDSLIRILNENISSEDDWAIFQTNFDRIHENFFRNLKSTYPELTSNDLRFCAYLRLNLSTKDIAHLMNISPKGVEVGRYRLRKKLGLDSHKSLTDFMIEFK